MFTFSQAGAIEALLPKCKSSPLKPASSSVKHLFPTGRELNLSVFHLTGERGASKEHSKRDRQMEPLKQQPGHITKSRNASEFWSRAIHFTTTQCKRGGFWLRMLPGHVVINADFTKILLGLSIIETDCPNSTTQQQLQTKPSLRTRYLKSIRYKEMASTTLTGYRKGNITHIKAIGKTMQYSLGHPKALGHPRQIIVAEAPKYTDGSDFSSHFQ